MLAGLGDDGQLLAISQLLQDTKPLLGVVAVEATKVALQDLVPQDHIQVPLGNLLFGVEGFASLGGHLQQVPSHVLPVRRAGQAVGRPLLDLTLQGGHDALEGKLASRVIDDLVRLLEPAVAVGRDVSGVELVGEVQPLDRAGHLVGKEEDVELVCHLGDVGCQVELLADAVELHESLVVDLQPVGTVDRTPSQVPPGPERVSLRATEERSSQLGGIEGAQGLRVSDPLLGCSTGEPWQDLISLEQGIVDVPPEDEVHAAVHRLGLDGVGAGAAADEPAIKLGGEVERRVLEEGRQAHEPATGMLLQVHPCGPGKGPESELRHDERGVEHIVALGRTLEDLVGEPEPVVTVGEAQDVRVSHSQDVVIADVL